MLWSMIRQALSRVADFQTALGRQDRRAAVAWGEPWILPNDLLDDAGRDLMADIRDRLHSISLSTPDVGDQGSFGDASGRHSKGRMHRTLRGG